MQGKREEMVKEERKGCIEEEKSGAGFYKL
jgi:hypothetical protein